MTSGSVERQTARTRRSIVRAAVFATIATNATTAARLDAQVYQIEAGTSSLLNATGISLETRRVDSSLVVSAGRLGDVFTVGALVKKRVRETTVSVGDDVVNFDLPSDLMTGSHYVPLRGVRIDRAHDGFRFSGFVGTTSILSGAPFFRGGTWGRPVVVAFADRSRSNYRLFSRNVVSARQTSIQGIEWRPRDELTVSAAGGIGNDQPYASSSISLDHRWLVGKAVVSSHPVGFRRIDVDAPMSSELQRENFSLVIRPDPRWSLNVARQNLVQDVAHSTTVPQVTVNQAGGSWNADGLRVGAAVFSSNSTDRNSLGTSLTIGQQLTTRLDLSADYFRYAPRDEPASDSGVLTLREVVHPRLSLLQVMTRSAGQTGVNVGGEFVSNPLSVNVSYQTIYAPLRPGNPFVQLIGVDVRVHGPRGLELRAGTYATASGTLKYMVSGHHILSSSGVNGPNGVQLPKYQFRGLVIDSESRPVAGAVVRLGSEIVLSGEDGMFVLGTARATPVPLAVLTDEFVVDGAFEVVSAPREAVPRIPSDTRDIRIVVRRKNER